MSLRIVDLTGQDLTAQPPVPVQLRSNSPNGAFAVIQCLLIEDDFLPDDFISGTLTWNDGSLPVVYNSFSGGTIAVNASRQLKPGFYVPRVEARNYVPPAGELVGVNFSITVMSPEQAPTVAPLIYGPILPKDSGFPNVSQWNWNTSSDLDILASSVKMLLTTLRGERVMNPEYGTNIKSILFQIGTKGTESLVQQEITDALVKWEPRVSLSGITVAKTGDREITVTATLTSKLNQQSFNLPLIFAQ